MSSYVGCDNSHSCIFLSKIMEKYSKRIIEALSLYDIPCVLNKQDKLVYSSLENSYGEIFCIYGYEETLIIAHAIYSPRVPENRRQCILQYLSGIKDRASGGNFYLDAQTQRIAYNMNYSLESPDSQEGNIYGFDIFCMEAYTMFIDHLEVLYDIIHNDIILSADAGSMDKKQLSGR